MAAHTPGPWHVAKGGLGREIRADDGPFIASVYDHTFTYGERNANARVLAAAPELLDALKQAVETIRTWHSLHIADDPAWDIYRQHAPEMKRINAAIAKAEEDSGVRPPLR